MTALQVPGIATRIRLVEHVPMAIEHRVVDGIAVDGLRRRRAQALVLKRSLTEVEDYKDSSKMQIPGVEFAPVALPEAIDISVGHVVHQVDLPSAQRRQAHRVLALGFANDF